MHRRAWIEGIGFWAPALPGWDIARAAFRGEAPPVEPPMRRPAPESMAAAERRRAPDSVLLALEVAGRAVAQCGRSPTELRSVFTSAHGDLAITDYMCSTLVGAPLALSPTKFLNSVHNASSGYWGIATGCRAASTSVSGFDCSFAAGLLEALTQCAADAVPVLLVGCDIAAQGPLASTNDSRGLLAVALVLAPVPTDRSVSCLEWALASESGEPIEWRSAAAQSLATNAMADALPVFEALAWGEPASLSLPLAATCSLRIQHRSAL